MLITTIGLDFAKNVFQVHAVGADGTVVCNKSLRRSQLHSFFDRTPPCLVGMEACATSHYWTRELTALGHDVRLIPPTYVICGDQVDFGVPSTARLTNRLPSVFWVRRCHRDVL